MAFRRPLIVAAWILTLAVPLLAQEGFPLFTTDFPPEEFAARRAKVYEAIGTDAFAVVQGAPSPPSYTRFRQSNELYYLCGVEVPHAYLLLDGRAKKATLFLPNRNEGREKGEGKVLSAEDAEEIKKLSGRRRRGLDRRPRRAAREPVRPAGPARPLHAARAGRGRLDEPGPRAALHRRRGRRPVRRAALARRQLHADSIRERFPFFEIKDLSPTLDALRLIKSERELAVLRKATKLAGLAILESMRSVRPGQYERELDAVAKFVFYRNGAQGDAYYSLIGSGRNAYWPHYNAGKRKMEDGDFLLMDYAPDYGYYMADVTRMFPVNGKFSQWQRELYGFYLACYREILKAIAPGKTGKEIIQQAGAGMEPILAAAKFSKPSHRKAAEDFVASYKKSGESEYPYVGHWVGMATHDVGSHEGPAEAGHGLHDRAGLDGPRRKDLRPPRGHGLHPRERRRGRLERRSVGHRRDREGDEGRGDAGEVSPRVSAGGEVEERVSSKRQAVSAAPRPARSLFAYRP